MPSRSRSLPARPASLPIFGAGLVASVLIACGGGGGGSGGPTTPEPVRPSIDDILPDPAPAGESVTISGGNFLASAATGALTPAATSVTISNRPMDIVSSTATSIVARVPLTLEPGGHPVRVSRDGVTSDPATLQVETFLVTGDFSGAVLTDVNSCGDGDPEGSTPQMTIQLTDARPNVTAVVDGRTLTGSLTVGSGQVDVDAQVVEGDRTFLLEGRVFLNEEDHRVFIGAFIERRANPDCEIRYRVQHARLGGP